MAAPDGSSLQGEDSAEGDSRGQDIPREFKQAGFSLCEDAYLLRLATSSKSVSVTVIVLEDA